ncbi:ADP-ribosylation factor-like protein [Plasmodium ovale wallikeri]|uniref:ADP-ribosylation factor-like protein n=1 Tax=Plasmodium ovale wallikeri TaxID=864142 RepID=A0A1A8Z208_PLAOA|nr:ADP-ribosylation factor-like protein [Plasmodium ovale wallikeri]SBT37846.1 ADP-ribosylation factor-like protein [Plasmodium ovale wallikeri]
MDKSDLLHGTNNILPLRRNNMDKWEDWILGHFRKSSNEKHLAINLQKCKVFNTFNDVNSIDETIKNELFIKYKIKDLINHYGNRIHHIFVDCKSCKLDKNWMDLMQQISYYF